MSVDQRGRGEKEREPALELEGLQHWEEWWREEGWQRQVPVLRGEELVLALAIPRPQAPA